MKIAKFVMLICLLPINSYSSYEDSNGYDSIVSELRGKIRNKQSIYDLENDPMDSVLFHTSFGYVNSVFSLDGNGIQSQTITQQGWSLGFGIDLFDPQWFAEVIFLNFPESTEAGTTAHLKEFDLKINYKTPLAREIWNLRMGAGLASRYLRIQTPMTPKADYTTPSTIISMGLEAEATPNISLTTEIAYKNSVIAETPEKQVYDLIFKIDGTY